MLDYQGQAQQGAPRTTHCRPLSIQIYPDFSKTHNEPGVTCTSCALARAEGAAPRPGHGSETSEEEGK